MKRTFVWLCVLYALVLLLAGCQSAASEPPLALSTSRPSLLFFYTDG